MLVALSFAITLGVYGLVAALVKMDDVGLYMLRKSLTGTMNGVQRVVGRSLLVAAPALMKTLAVVGTVAMFLVGGGILTHSIGFLHHVSTWSISIIPSLPLVMSVLADGVVGIVAGAIIAVVVSFASKLKS